MHLMWVAVLRSWRALTGTVSRWAQSVHHDPGYTAWACLTVVFISGIAAICFLAVLLIYLMIRVRAAR
jgi:hypothetical protein